LRFENEQPQRLKAFLWRGMSVWQSHTLIQSLIRKAFPFWREISQMFHPVTTVTIKSGWPDIEIRIRARSSGVPKRGRKKEAGFNRCCVHPPSPRRSAERYRQCPHVLRHFIDIWQEKSSPVGPVSCSICPRAL